MTELLKFKPNILDVRRHLIGAAGAVVQRLLDHVVRGLLGHMVRCLEDAEALTLLLKLCGVKVKNSA